MRNTTTFRRCLSLRVPPPSHKTGYLAQRRHTRILNETWGTWKVGLLSHIYSEALKQETKNNCFLPWNCLIPPVLLLNLDQVRYTIMLPKFFSFFIYLKDCNKTLSFPNLIVFKTLTIPVIQDKHFSLLGGLASPKLPLQPSISTDHSASQSHSPFDTFPKLWPSPRLSSLLIPVDSSSLASF